MKEKLYLAAPLFSELEKEFNVRVKNILSEKFEVFLPQEDGGLLVNMVKDGTNNQVARQKIFKWDIDAMKKSDVIFAILDGRTIDEGTVFELGYAFALGKKCYALQTDPRRLLPEGNNVMIDGSLEHTFHSLDELIKWLKEV